METVAPFLRAVRVVSSEYEEPLRHPPSTPKTLISGFVFLGSPLFLFDGWTQAQKVRPILWYMTAKSYRSDSAEEKGWWVESQNG